MNKQIAYLIMSIFLISSVSAFYVDVQVEEYANGTISLDFYLENPSEDYYNGYAILVPFNSSELEPLYFERFSNGVFGEYENVLDLNGILVPNTSVQSSALGGQWTQNQGSLGTIGFNKLVENFSDFTNITISINLWNETIEITKEVHLTGKLVCEPNWVLGDWGECISGEQEAEYTDSNNCGLDAPTSEVQSCSTGGTSGGSSSGGGSSKKSSSGGSSSSINKCDKIWGCSIWGECVDGLQTRTCQRPSGCYSDTKRPAEERECEIAQEDVIVIDENKEEEENSSLILILILLGILFVFIIVMIILKENKDM